MQVWSQFALILLSSRLEWRAAVDVEFETIHKVEETLCPYLPHLWHK
jgi:hypothetical protein